MNLKGLCTTSNQHAQDTNQCANDTATLFKGQYLAYIGDSDVKQSYAKSLEGKKAIQVLSNPPSSGHVATRMQELKG